MRPRRARIGVGRRTPVVAGIIGWFVFACVGARAEPGGGTVADLYREFAPATVAVKLITDGSESGGIATTFASTGFFIDREGRILTSIRTTGTVTRSFVTHAGLEYGAQLVGADHRTNIALLQILRTPAGFAVIPIDAATRPLTIGEPLLGLTHPVELEVSPSPGLVTGFESQLPSVVFPCTYLRANIRLGGGEAGAPLLDHEGRLAGMAIAGLPDVLSSYSVPTRAIARVVSDLKEHGRVHYGTLPVEFTEVPDSVYVALQVVVSKVRPKSSAESADLRPGDVVRRIGERPIRRMNDMRDALFFARPGEFLTIEVERAERTQLVFNLPVEALTDEVPPPAPPGAASPG